MVEEYKKDPTLFDELGKASNENLTKLLNVFHLNLNFREDAEVIYCSLYELIKYCHTTSDRVAHCSIAVILSFFKTLEYRWADIDSIQSYGKLIRAVEKALFELCREKLSEQHIPRMRLPELLSTFSLVISPKDGDLEVKFVEVLSDLKKKKNLKRKGLNEGQLRDWLCLMLLLALQVGQQLIMKMLRILSSLMIDCLLLKKPLLIMRRKQSLKNV